MSASALRVLFFTTLFCSGCAVKYDQNWLSEEWTQALQTYNIKAIYPPTEDIHIGDVFALATGERDKRGNLIEGALWSSVKLAYVPMQAQLDDYYSKVPSFPATPDAPSGNGIWRQPTTDVASHAASGVAGASDVKVAAEKKVPVVKGKKLNAHAASPVIPPTVASHTQPPTGTADSDKKPIINVYAADPVWNRLPLVAFPGFTIAHADAQSFGASVPLRFFQAIFGFERNHQDDVSITIRAAETYGVPAIVAKQALIKFCNDQKTIGTCESKNINIELNTLSGTDSPPGNEVALVNRIYLTRSIEYTYKSSTAKGAQANLYVLLQKALTNQQALTTALSSKAATQSGTAKPSTPGTPTDKAAAAPKAAASGVAAASDASSNTVQDAGQLSSADLTAVKASMDNLLASLQAANQQLGASPVPGSTFSVGSISEDQVSLIQTFDRPLAIGYRYVAIAGTNPAGGGR
ncbi:hypothetical protein ABH944_008425 [Caballeronia udeis]|uniref:Lipoprotein n=1 Tax=Caballeronia udeis TaxID=1232866 RepID=A0ABW8MYB9_9BURK